MPQLPNSRPPQPALVRITRHTLLLDALQEQYVRLGKFCLKIFLRGPGGGAKELFDFIQLTQVCALTPSGFLLNRQPHPAPTGRQPLQVRPGCADRLEVAPPYARCLFLAEADSPGLQT